MIAELVEHHDVRDHAQAAGVTSRSQNNALKKMATQVGANMAKQTEAMRKQQTETGKKRTGTVTTEVRQTNTILFAMASGQSGHADRGAGAADVHGAGVDRRLC